MADAVDDLSDLLGPEPVKDPPASVPALTPGRARQRRSRSLGVKPRKLSQDRMLRVLTAIAQMPVAGQACMRAGISFSTLKYWLISSAEGREGDGYDVVLTQGDDPVRFHTAWEDMMELGMSLVEQAAFKRALGYLEPLTFQGRVIYKHDPELVALFGYECMQTYKLDPITGEPEPESVMKQDPDLMMFLLKTRKPDMYGNKQQIDVNMRGGVLVVAATAATPQAVTEDYKDYKADAIEVEFEETGWDNT